MKHLQKTWLAQISGSKKFLASDLAHRLSRSINRRKFEVVFEGFIDIHNIDSEQPDIVVYDKDNNFHPVMIIEIADKDSLSDTLRTIEILSRIYHINESFIFDIDTEKWHLLKLGQNTFEENSISDSFGIILKQLRFAKAS